MILCAFDSETGILIVGHGSRNAGGNRPLLDLCPAVEQRLDVTPVQPCYLELARPTIPEGLAALHRRGVRRAIVLPLQLTAGQHVRVDIPREVALSLTQLSNMTACFTQHLGGHPRLMEIADFRLDQAMAGRSNVDSTAYVLVGRGSRDPLVRGELIRLARIRQARVGAVEACPCFLAMGTPSFEETLDNLVSRNPDRVIVQPYLLFSGRLLTRIQQRVAVLTEQFPQIEWVTAGALGPDPRFEECALDLAHQVLQHKPQFRRELVGPRLALHPPGQ